MHGGVAHVDDDVHDAWPPADDVVAHGHLEDGVEARLGRVEVSH